MSLDHTIAQGEIVCLNRTIKVDRLWAKAQSLLQDENSQWFCNLFATFSLQNVTGLDAGLDGKS